VAVPAKAQIKFGIKGGVNISSVHFSKEVFNADNVTGFQVGPMLEVMVPIAGLGVDAAVLYSQKGLGVGSETVKTDYIDVPVNLKWKFGLPILKVYVAAGPYVGFRVGGSKFWDLPKQIGGQLETKSFSAGLNFGAGVEVVKHLQVGINYGLGLTDNYSLNLVKEIITGGKNRGFSVTAAILF
ncbi:MAG: porin family protein, partial [Tannerellaceae bacterium]